MVRLLKQLSNQPHLVDDYAEAFSREQCLSQACEDIMFLRAFTLAQVGFSFSRPHSSGLFGKAEATIQDCALNCNVGTSE